MRKKKMTIDTALEKLLVLAEAKLENAVKKEKAWDIEHYKKDIEKIKSQMK